MAPMVRKQQSNPKSVLLCVNAKAVTDSLVKQKRWSFCIWLEQRTRLLILWLNKEMVIFVYLGSNDLIQTAICSCEST